MRALLALHPRVVYDVNAYGLRWSPDGTRLAFYGRPSVDPLAQFEVQVIGVDGSGVVSLSREPVNDVQPAW